jgi:hypothetical protein
VPYKLCSEKTSVIATFLGRETSCPSFILFSAECCTTKGIGIFIMRFLQRSRFFFAKSSSLVHFIFIFLNSQFIDSSYTTEVLKPAFEKSFHDRCTTEKYPFVKKFVDKLENPGHRFVHFVLHEHGFHNGGFGDRLAGLLTATAMALRFDRQILIQANNGFDELFEPYRPPGIRPYVQLIYSSLAV